MIAHEHGPQQFPETLVLGGEGEAAGKAHGKLALPFAQGGLVVGAVEAAQVLHKGAQVVGHAIRDLTPLDGRIADRAQVAAQVGHAPVVEGEGGVPCGLGIGKMAAHLRGLEAFGLHVLHIGRLLGPDAAFPFAIEADDGFPAEFGIAQPEHVVEGLFRRPAFRPLVLFTQKVEEGGVQAVGPAAFVVERALFLLEFHVELGQDEKEGNRTAPPQLGRFARRISHPFVDDGGEVLHFLIAGSDAQEHARQFQIAFVALEEVGHLAAQEEFMKLIRLGEFAGHVVGLETRAVAGKVEQIGVLEEIVGPVAHGDGQFRRERGHLGPAGLDAPAVLRGHFKGVASVLPQTAQGGHVDDAAFAGQQGRCGAEGFIGMPERLKDGAQAQVEGGEGFGLIPQKLEERGPVLGGETPGQPDGTGPVEAFELLDHGGGAEVARHVVLQIGHVVFVEGGLPQRVGRHGAGQRVHAGGQRLFVGHGEVAAVGVVGVDEDFDDVELGEQAKFHGKQGRPFALAEGESCDEPRGFLAARGIDVLQEVRRRVTERGQERAVRILRQC